MSDTSSKDQQDNFKKEAAQVGFSQFTKILLRALYVTPLGWLVIFALSYEDVPPINFFAWNSIFLLGWIISLVCLNKLIKIGSKVEHHQTLVLIIVALYGVLWGTMLYAIMGYDIVLDSWVATLLVGIISANLPGYITYPKAFYVLLISIWLSATLSVLSISDRFDLAWKLILTMLVYFVALMFILRSVSRSVIDGIKMQLLNKALAEKLQISLETVSHQAHTDALTGLLNRHALNKSLDDFIVKGERRRTTFSLLMIDVDYFKNINDTYGHDVGDQAIKHVADVIMKQLRDEDFCARFGGEEFVVLLPEAHTTDAIYVAERIRKAVEMSPLKKPKHHITVSIGLATHQPGMTAEMLLKAADDEVYKGKEQGRNQVSIANTDNVKALSALSADQKIFTCLNS